MSEERAAVTESREKRGILGEWPWQVRSFIGAVVGWCFSYTFVSGIAPPRNWVDKFLLLPCAASLAAVHTYALLLWLYYLVRGKPEPSENSKPELD